MRLDNELIAEGLAYLSKEDQQMAAIISAVGDFRLTYIGSGYAVLVRSILSQQISTAAATTIRTRLQEMIGSKRITPEAVSKLTGEEFQAIGISRQKRKYLNDLTARCLDGSLNFRRLAHSDDETAIEELVAIKGIGRWTAQMFLMFGLRRSDVFAPDDLGLQNAVTQQYGFPVRIQANDLASFAQRWSPFRTIAAWYLWRSLELEG